MAEKKSTAKKKDERTRNYATVVYLDSAPENWLDILRESKVPIFISPYHDKDLNANGEPKKPHYHVMWLNEGKKSEEQAREFFATFGGVGLEKVISVRGYARYLCHLDNPEKAQYSVDEVQCLGGADYFGTINLVTDKYKAIGEMIDYCVDNQVCSYSNLLIYCRNERYDWFRVLCDNGTVVMKEFLKSLDWTMRQG